MAMQNISDTVESVHSSWLTHWFTVISNTFDGIIHYLIAPMFARQITSFQDFIDIINKDVLHVDGNKEKTVKEKSWLAGNNTQYTRNEVIERK